MKILLTLALLASTTMWQTQTTTPISPDLIVTKFTWSKYVTGSGLLHPLDADPAPGPIVINRAPARDPNYQRPAANPQERRAELAALERAAANSTNRRTDFYVYRLQIKNVGSGAIRSFVWASENPADSGATPLREFFCLVKTKPNETKSVEILSTIAPSPVVSADKSGEKTGKGSSLSAVITWIEYADGSIWERPGGHSSTLSSNTQPKIGSGRCVRL